MLVLNHLKSKQPDIINFQNSASDPLPISEPVGIPSLISGLFVAHTKYGKLKWPEILQPAIELAEKGFSVSIQLANATQNLPEDSPLRTSQFFFPNNIPLAEGKLIRNAPFSKLLKAVSVNGSAGISNFQVKTKLW